MPKFYQPTILLPKLAPPKPFDWKEGIAVRSPNWLGDAVMALPALLRLKQAMPRDKKLWVATPPSLHDVWGAAPWIDGLVPFDTRRTFNGLPGAFRELKPGAILVLPNSTRSALEARLSGTPIRVGRSGRFRSLLLNRKLPAWRPSDRHADFHQASHYLALASLLAPIETTLPARPLASIDSRQVLVELGIAGTPPFLAMAPGAAYGPAKQWPPECFASVARHWTETGGRVIIVGTEGDAQTGNAIRAAVGKQVLSVCGRTSLRQLMGVLAEANCVVANDSGAMHLAAALGTPGVAVFGSTNPQATGPIGAPWIALSQPPPCAPCFERSCPLETERYKCLRSITVAQVAAALAELPSPVDRIDFYSPVN